MSVKDGTYTLYDAEGDCVGRVCTEVGRAMIGDAFYVKERTCHSVFPNKEWFQCSECGAFVAEYGVTNATSPIPITFCPNCGAKVVRDD